MKKAFTLIELLVVVLIIGILAALVLPQYRIAVEKSRAGEAMLNVRALGESAKRYVLATGEIPKSFDEMDISIPGTELYPNFINNGHYVYYLEPPRRLLCAVKTNSQNVNTTPWFNGEIGIGYWIEDDTRITLVKAGELYCVVKNTASRYSEYLQVCKSLTGSTEKICTDGDWEYYKFR